MVQKEIGMKKYDAHLKNMTSFLVGLGFLLLPGFSFVHAQNTAVFPYKIKNADRVTKLQSTFLYPDRRIYSSDLDNYDKILQQNPVKSESFVYSIFFHSEDKLCTITLLPFLGVVSFWKSNWFIITFSCIFFILVITIISWRIQTIKILAREKLKVTQLKAEQLQTRLESEQIVNYFSNSLIGKHNLDDVLWDVARNLIGRLGFVDCIIYIWNEDKTKMIQKAGFGPKGTADRIGKETFEVFPGQGLVGYVIQSKEPLLINDTSIDQRYRIDDMVRNSEITIPIISDNELIGIIDSEHPEKNFYTDRHLQILSMIATLVAAKMKSIEAERILQSTRFEILSMNEQLSKARLEALRSQMNPHFIFNCINSIDGLIQSDDKYHATVYLNKFAKLIRNILDSSKKDTVSVSKDLETLKLYIDLEKFRNENKFTADIEADEELLLDDYQIPPLIIQPFVENAIQHGLRNRDGSGGKLWVRAHKKGAFLEYIIEDNGVGRNYLPNQLKEYSSYGIDMSTDRVKLFNRESRASVQITDLFKNDISSGTKVQILLKIDEC